MNVKYGVELQHWFSLTLSNLSPEDVTHLSQLLPNILIKFMFHWGESTKFEKSKCIIIIEIYNNNTKMR